MSSIQLYVIGVLVNAGLSALLIFVILIIFFVAIGINDIAKEKY